MAKFELKFLDALVPGVFIKAELQETHVESFINISLTSEDYDFCIWLDKSTAIKFAKTLRTEINKIQ